MTQEDKQLLLKDLCARLPYHPIVYVDENLSRLKLGVATRVWEYIAVDRPCKPYLRPMSSMTKEERKEIGNLIKENRPSPYGIINNKGIDNLLFSVSVTSGVLVDWLNAHHFDFRNLIERGLALEAPKDMYNLNK